MPRGLANLSESPQGADLLLSGPGGAQQVAGSRAATGSLSTAGWLLSATTVAKGAAFA